MSSCFYLHVIVYFAFPPFCTKITFPFIYARSSLAYSDDDNYILISTLDSSQRLFPRYIPKEERQRDNAFLQVYKGHINKKYAVSTHILPSYSVQKRYILSGCDKGKVEVLLIVSFFAIAIASSLLFQQKLLCSCISGIW